MNDKMSDSNKYALAEVSPPAGGRFRGALESCNEKSGGSA